MSKSLGSHKASNAKPAYELINRIVELLVMSAN